MDRPWLLTVAARSVGPGRWPVSVTLNGGTIRGGDAKGVGTLTVGGNVTLNTNAQQIYRITTAGYAPRPRLPAAAPTGTVPNTTNNNFVDYRARSASSPIQPTFQRSTSRLMGQAQPFRRPNPTAIRSAALATTRNSARFNLNNQSQFTAIGFSDLHLLIDRRRCLGNSRST